MTVITQEFYELYKRSPGGNKPQNSSFTATNLPSRKPSKLDEPDMRDTVGEVRANSYTMYSYGPLHMDEKTLNDQLKPINNRSVLIQDVA